MEIGASTRLLAILGDPVAHSLSPLMQNAATRALGIDACYVAMRVPAAALRDTLASLTAAGAAGNVTIPHKEAVERSVARKTDVCARVGACNTFWAENGALVGDNTDVAAVRDCVKALGADGAGRWLVIGTGGSARAVAVAAGDAGAAVLVQSRDPARAHAFVDWARERGIAAEAARAPGGAEVIVNATPLGLTAGDPMPLDPRLARGCRVALDLVYRPGGTPWTNAMRAAGAAAQDGRDVLVRQGAAAFERFFGTAAPLEVMRAAVTRALDA